MSRKLWFIALVALTLLVGLVPTATAGPPSVPSSTAPVAFGDDARTSPIVDEKLRLQFEVTETDRFVVVFADRPDLRKARDISDFVARGQFVVDELQAVAERSQRRALAVVAEQGGRADSFWFRNVMIVEGDETLVEALAALPGVAEIRAERVYPLVRPIAQRDPAKTAAGEPEWGIAKIRADQVWDEGILGGGVVIANVDTGVDYTHEALVSQYRGSLGNGEFSHDYNWWDPTGICGDAPCDNQGHGTHTMGTMVGGDGPGPFSPDIGVAPGAQWIAAKGCEDASCSEGALLSAGQWILAPTDLEGENPDPAKRPDIVNNSWGAGPGDPFYLETVQNWRAAGIIPVFSAGNDGPTCGTGGSPGDFNETFSVGATDVDDIIAYFSGRGPSVFGKVNPNVSAPGVDVTSSVPGNSYVAFDGTSMAAPHVAGTLALVMSSTSDLYGDVDGATSVVASTAAAIIDMTCGGDDDGDPNNVYGEGRIDAYGAVQLVATGGTLTGTVRDVESGDPIPGARVTASAEGRAYAATAGDDGVYVMFLPANEYAVTAEAFAYETAVVAGVVVEVDVITTQDLGLTPLPHHTVSGRVLRAENRAPVEGAAVRALGTPAPPAITDARGAYSLTLPLGVYTLEASKNGCLSTEHTEVELFRDVRRNLGLVLLLDDFTHACEVIPYDWIDAQNPTTIYGDDTTGRLPLPFPFEYFGVDYDELFIATNGYLAFEDTFYGSSEPFNVPIPDQFLPNAAIYALWQNMWVVGAAHVDYDVLTIDGQQVLVVEYSGVPLVGEDEGADFEVKLWEDGTVDLLYGATIDNAGGGAAATVGIEDANGRDGLMFSHNSPVLQPEMALRYSVVPTGTVAGTVTNLNDGLPVAGATVTASPGGRSALTDESGAYSLRLVPGSYSLTYESDDYEVASRAVRIRVDRTVTIDVALAAPLAVVEPASIAAATEVGVPATATVTVRNLGSSPLTWVSAERETGLTPPDLAPVSARVLWSAGSERPAIPEGFQPDLTALPTYEGPLEQIIADPTGDAASPVDVVGLSAGADQVEVSFEIVYSADTPSGVRHNFLYLDVDQDPASGIPPGAWFGLPTQDIGMEYFVESWSDGADSFAWLVDAETFLAVAELGVIVGNQTFRFDIPLDLLGGDDGAMDVALTSDDGLLEGFDWAPDEGHGSVEPFRDVPWMSAEPVAGTLLPGESGEVTVTLGGTGFDPGDYAAVLVLFTNDPRQSVRVVDVDLTIELPEGFGGLQGTIANARSGSPAPALLSVQAERDGEPYPVEERALDTDGTYLLFAPAGTWPATVDLEGYASWAGEMTISAGTTTTLDVALDPLWPLVTLEGGPIEMELAAGQTATAELTLGNLEGLTPLEFELLEREGAAAEIDVTAAHGTHPAPARRGASTRDAPEGWVAVTPDAHTADGAEVALFMDNYPWDSEALPVVLDANGIPYDLYGSDAMGSVDLGAYRIVMTANDQSQGFYESYGANADRFADFVAGGGLLWFGAAAWGWYGGDATGLHLPGGVEVGGFLEESMNRVLEPDHPIMIGVPDPFYGTSASNTWFENVPSGSALANGGNSNLETLLEYGYGAGRVLAIGQTLEYAWANGQDGDLILENAVPYVYAFRPFVDVTWLGGDPVSGTVDAGAVQPLTVTVDATGLAPGDYLAELVVISNDPLNDEMSVPVSVTVTG